MPFQFWSVIVLSAADAAWPVFNVAPSIYERKLVEESLRRSEARLRSLYEATPAMLQSIDAHGRLLTVSDTWLRKLGYTRAAVIGRPFTEFMPITSQRLFLDVLERRLHDQGHSQGDWNQCLFHK